MRRRRRIATTSAAGVVVLAGLAWFGVAGGGVGCGPGDMCPNDGPTSCPSPAPSFSGQVQPIFQTKCGTCHGPGGVNAATPFLTYAQVAGNEATRTSILFRVEKCEMPKAPAPPLTAEERQVLLAWISSLCGAPNN